MPDWMMWFTRLDNSKIFALLLFSSAYVAVLVYIFTGKARKKRLESYKYIPLQDDDTKPDEAEKNSQG